VHEGWEYVVASYGVAAVTLGVWFWMIGAKLRRLRRRERDGARG
jgi:hypothetical protein